MLCLAAAGGL
ncbi:hypothetical protein VCHC21A1_2471, partial [Vibrio cholerae HC-21A1]